VGEYLSGIAYRLTFASVTVPCPTLNSNPSAAGTAAFVPTSPKVEPMVADYHAKLAKVEPAVLAIDPQLWLPPRRHKPNPVFKRQELSRLVMGVLRKAEEPLPVRHIARLALAAKKVRYPEPSLLKKMRVWLQQYLGKLDQRGVTRKIGTGNGTQ